MSAWVPVTYRVLGDRPTAGHQTLDLIIGVRIPVPQLTKPQKYSNMNQYIIIVVPSLEIIERVDKYRKIYARYTDYVIVPHFTIYPSFYITPGYEENVIQLLRNSFKGTEVVTINFSGVGYFESGNNVAFFKPDTESSIFLKSLLLETTEILKGKIRNVHDDRCFLPENFSPHMTIAEKIPEEVFRSVKKELDDINEKGSFTVSSVFLYTQTVGENLWCNAAEITF